jgi:methionyl-tRNA formyltransferase
MFAANDYMTKSDFSLIYMGTPEFAVAPLRALVANGYAVKLVVTVADKPSGRGLKLKPSAVKQAADELGIPVMQPQSLKDESFVQKLRNLNPKLIVVVAFRMLPKVVWEIPSFGTINLHASLLPNYRGAAPINWAIIHGERETGLTTFLIDEKIDTGAILFQERLIIYPEDSAGSLHDRMLPLGADLVVQTCDAIRKGEINAISQNTLQSEFESLKDAPRIFPADCIIDWKQPASKILNFIRGLNPYPGAFTSIADAHGKLKKLKVFEAKAIEDQHGNPGEFVHQNGELLIFCRTGAVQVTNLQLEGKKRMDIQSFSRGNSLDGARAY